MDKMSILCVTQFIKRLNSDNSIELFDVVQDVSSWLSKSVYSIGELNSFNSVQEELINLAQNIVAGKGLTKHSVNRLGSLLKDIQKEMLFKIKIVVFVMPSIKIKFNEGISKVVVDNDEEAVDVAYGMKEELKYLVYMNDEEVSYELKNAVDIVISFEELIEAVNICFPIDIFVYDRLYLEAKLNKIEEDKSNILITGSSHSMFNIFEDRVKHGA